MVEAKIEDAEQLLDHGCRHSIRPENIINAQGCGSDHSRASCKPTVFKFHKVDKASLNVESFLTQDGRSAFDRHMMLLTSEPHRHALEQMKNSIEHQILTNTICESSRLLEIRTALSLIADDNAILIASSVIKANQKRRMVPKKHSKQSSSDDAKMDASTTAANNVSDQALNKVGTSDAEI